MPLLPTLQPLRSLPLRAVASSGFCLTWTALTTSLLAPGLGHLNNHVSRNQRDAVYASTAVGPIMRAEYTIMKNILKRWPVIRQIAGGGDGTGPEAMSPKTLKLHMKNRGSEVARSICPYCAVGCGQLVFHRRASSYRSRATRRPRFPAGTFARKARRATSCSHTRTV